MGRAVLGDGDVAVAPVDPKTGLPVEPLPAPAAMSLGEQIGPVVVALAFAGVFGGAGFFAGRWAARKVEKWLF